jgi:predicted  nucleic acid-binding Zn-ribbon protein
LHSLLQPHFDEEEEQQLDDELEELDDEEDELDDELELLQPFLHLPIFQKITL